MVQNRAFSNGDNIIIQINGKSPESKYDLSKLARGNGYSIVLHMVDVAPEISALRVFQRALNPDQSTGIRQMIPPTLPLNREYQYNPRHNFFHVVGDSARSLHQGNTPAIDAFRFWHSSAKESSVVPTTSLASTKPDDRLDQPTAYDIPTYVNQPRR